MEAVFSSVIMEKVYASFLFLFSAFRYNSKINKDFLNVIK